MGQKTRVIHLVSVEVTGVNAANHICAFPLESSTNPLSFAVFLQLLLLCPLRSTYAASEASANQAAQHETFVREDGSPVYLESIRRIGRTVLFHHQL